MTGLSGPGTGDPQGTAKGAAGVADAAEYLAVRARGISNVIESVDAAVRTPNELLDIKHGQSGEAGGAGAGEVGDTGTQAEYFFIMARECRDQIRTIDKALQATDWPRKSALVFTTTFEDLNDAWGTYKVLLEFYYSVKGEEGPSRDRALAALQAPRRGFVKALRNYNSQLDVVLGYVEDIRSQTA